MRRLITSPDILPEDQINKVLNFAEFLHQKQRTTPPTKAIASGITGPWGIVKRLGPAPSEDELQADYTDYLTPKYQ